MNRRNPGLVLLVVSASLGLTAAAPESPLKAGLESVNADDLLGHIRVLASDEFEGRAPGSPGEERTVRYLVEQFKKLGLTPGNPDGSYVQDVPLVGFQVKSARGEFHFDAGDKTIDLRFPDNWVAVSRRPNREVKVERSDVVFVGYGVVAPEYGWDDYKGLDARGKTLVMLINDPPVVDPNDGKSLDPKVFKGRAMTYYGRWTYKYEIGSEKGAAAVVIVHETGPAGYPFAVVQGSWSRENFDIATGKGGSERVAVESWISLETAKQLFAACGQDFETLKAAAARRDFQPVPLGAKADFSVESTRREVRSRNVIGRLEGSDPKLRAEHVVYTAHWDHLGRDPGRDGDQIFNGAADNASGVAALLEIARAFSKRKPPPKRSILFLAVTAEEKGLLGAKYYATHPLYPLETTLVDINMDVINLWGRTRDITLIGKGESTLDGLVVEAAARQGRVVEPDPEPEKGMFYRSDHFEFAKQGVPALDPKSGIRYLGKPDDYGLRKRDEYTQNDYHKVTDEVKPDWDLSGAIDDIRLLVEVGDAIAEGDAYPEWLPGTEFRARREARLRGRRP